MTQVKIYSTPHCPYCLIAKNYFKKHNIEFVEVDVESDEAALKEMLEKSKQYEVPVFEIDSEVIIGFKKAKIDELLGLKQV